MRVAAYGLVLWTTAMVLSSAATACTYVEDPRFFGGGKLDDAIYNLLENRAVQQARDCSFENGGERDTFSGKAAFDAGNGRIAQLIRDANPLRDEELLIVDCNEREAAILIGVLAESQENAECSPIFTDQLSNIVAPAGNFRLGAGETFAEFLAYSDVYGMTYSEELQYYIQDYRSKDQIDLLCGCKVFYPDSPGALN